MTASIYALVADQLAYCRVTAASLQHNANHSNDEWLRGLWTGEALAYRSMAESLLVILGAKDDDRLSLSKEDCMGSEFVKIGNKWLNLAALEVVKDKGHEGLYLEFCSTIYCLQGAEADELRAILDNLAINSPAQRWHPDDRLGLADTPVVASVPPGSCREFTPELLS